MKYGSSIYNGLKVMAKVKVFVQAALADADADVGAMTLYLLGSLNSGNKAENI